MKSQLKKINYFSFGCDSFNSERVQAAVFSEHCNEFFISFHLSKFRQHVGDCRLLKKDSATWILLMSSLVTFAVFRDTIRGT